jgi:hypothetical protein
MAEDSKSANSSIVAIFAIVMLMLIGAFIAWQMGAFGGRGKSKKLAVPVSTGQIPQPMSAR